MSDSVPAVNEPDATRIRLDIAYDGSAFKGWSKQPGLRTVEGQIEGSIKTIFRRYPPAPRLVVAGRTDAGVHALGQVAHVDVSPAQIASLLRLRRGGKREFDAATVLTRRINGILGPASDLVITGARIAPTGFEARFSALWRRYEYRVADAHATRNPLMRSHTIWYPVALDHEAMNEAAQTLLGLHDFAAYCKARQGATSIRTLQEFSWHRDDDGVLIASVKADAFCHSMVRSLVGACVTVGEGKLSVGDVALLRDDRRRTGAFKVMPARGLTMIGVGYPDASGLAARAEETRARRTLVDARLTSGGLIA